jgi:hypothetical protein
VRGGLHTFTECIDEMLSAEPEFTHQFDNVTLLRLIIVAVGQLEQTILDVAVEAVHQLQQLTVCLKKQGA